MTPESALTRRAILGRAARGVGSLALASLLGDASGRIARGATAIPSDAWPATITPLHKPAKAKRVIWLYMAGGMSPPETFDHKPKLTELHGQPMPESVTAGQQIAQV